MRTTVYGPLKARCEAEARKAFGDDRTCVVRPGLIVGPGDYSDRFTYWPVRISKGGEVMAPGNPTDPVQFIDCRDLGEWYIRLVEDGTIGTFNGVGPRSPMSIAGMLYGIRATVDNDISFTWVPADFLEEHEVAAVDAHDGVGAADRRVRRFRRFEHRPRDRRGSDLPAPRRHRGGDHGVLELAARRASRGAQGRLSRRARAQGPQSLAHKGKKGNDEMRISEFPTSRLWFRRVRRRPFQFQNPDQELMSFFNRIVAVEKDEVGPMLWAALYYFLLLAAYFVIRPIRDEMGVEGGVRNLSWLFLGTLVGMLLVHPLFTALVSRLPRRLFIPLAYTFFAINLVLFWYAFQVLSGTSGIWAGRIFFIWTSVFNLFVVSIFWSLMSDLFRPEQAKRLFGFVAIGGTVGAVVGSSVTAFLAHRITPTNLLLVSAVVLGLAMVVAHRLMRTAPRSEDDASPLVTNEADQPVGGGILDGIRTALSSPYLLGIVGYMLLYTITATFLYFQQAEIVEARLQRTSRANGVFRSGGSRGQLPDRRHPDLLDRPDRAPHRDRPVVGVSALGLRLRLYCRRHHARP